MDERRADTSIHCPLLSGASWSHLHSPWSSGAQRDLGEALGQNWEHCVPSWVPICLPTLNARLLVPLGVLQQAQGDSSPEHS